MKGYLFVIAASLIYGIEPALRALALQAGALPGEISFLNTLVCFITSVIICAICHSKLRISLRHALQLLLAGGIGLGITNVLITSACQFIPVGCVTVIHFMYPSLVCVALALFFRQRITSHEVLAILLSIVGLILISGSGLSGSRMGISLAFLSSLTYLSYILLLDKGSSNTIPLKVRLFYISLGSVLACAINLLFQQSRGTWDAPSAVIVCLCGALSCIACICFAAGVRQIGSSAASFCSLLEPLSSIVFGAIIYRNHFSFATIAGCAFSLIAILLVFTSNHKKAQTQQNHASMQ